MEENSSMEVIDLEGENQSENVESQFLQNESIDEYCKRVMGFIRNCQKCCGDVQGWHHYSDFSGVHFTMTRINNLLHSLISQIFSHQDIKLNINGMNMIDQFDIIREGNDALIEKIGSYLDEAFGNNQNSNIEILEPTVQTIRGPVNEDTGQQMVLLASRTTQKPQLFFSPKINNSAKEPFIPVIKEKPNNIKPLSILICLTPAGREYYSHPYDYELQHWSPNESFQQKDPILPVPLQECPFQLIENEQSLKQMVRELSEVTEIAVDVENHTFRSYQGLTCLIQISTRTKDYIIDPFPIRNHLSILNEVFTNSKITKVFHGADYDITWLQRDGSVYVVNMFDTHQAAIVLDYSHRSLASLLHKFCQITANKTYQRADWRIRPLPESFITYARQDSHYLLYIYDLMRNELIEKGNELGNLLEATYSRSTELCLKRYEKPIVGPDSFVDLYRKSRKQFNKRQLFALQQIYLWRDKIAREQDESVDFVLPKHMMLQMAEILPKEMQGILRCCNPIPPLIKTEQFTLHQIIRTARETNEDEFQISQELNQIWGNNPLKDIPDARDVHDTLISQHDLFLVEDEPAGLSTLLNPQETLLGDLFSPKSFVAPSKNTSSFFGLKKKDVRCTRVNLSIPTTEFMSPYERYKVLLENPLKEVEKPAAPPPPPPIVDDECRINKIKSYFLSLSQDSLPPSKKGKQKGAAMAESSISDQARLDRLQEHIANLSKDVTSDTTKLTKAQKKRNRLKRRSAELNRDDNSRKKIKGSPVKNEKPQEVGSLEPFDYSQANYDMFKSNIRPKRRTFKGSFRGKARKQPNFKNATKSVTYGKRRN